MYVVLNHIYQDVCGFKSYLSTYVCGFQSYLSRCMYVVLKHIYPVVYSFKSYLSRRMYKVFNHTS